MPTHEVFTLESLLHERADDEFNHQLRQAVEQFRHALGNLADDGMFAARRGTLRNVHGTLDELDNLLELIVFLTDPVRNGGPRWLTDADTEALMKRVEPAYEALRERSRQRRVVEFLRRSDVAAEMKREGGDDAQQR